VRAEALIRGLGDGALSRPLNEMIMEWRLITHLMRHALSAGAQDREASPYPGITLEKAIEPRWPSLRWPARLAMAVEAAACGKPEVARRYLEGMPSWPEGSRMEETRRELLATSWRRDFPTALARH
jgi:hypothetical protein